MALTGTITIHGASAGAVFHDHGSISFSPFTKYSAFLSDQFSFGPSSYTEIDSGSLTLISKKYGDLVATDVDTINAAYGGDTVISGSVSLNFVFGSTTTSLFSAPYSDTIPGSMSSFSASSTLKGAAADLKALEAELLKPAPAATPSVAAAASSVTPAIGAAGTQIDLGDSKVNLIKLDHNKA